MLRLLLTLGLLALGQGVPQRLLPQVLLNAPELHSDYLPECIPSTTTIKQIRESTHYVPDYQTRREVSVIVETSVRPNYFQSILDKTVDQTRVQTEFRNILRTQQLVRTSRIIRTAPGRQIISTVQETSYRTRTRTVVRTNLITSTQVVPSISSVQSLVRISSEVVRPVVRNVFQTSVIRVPSPPVVRQEFTTRVIDRLRQVRDPDVQQTVTQTQRSSQFIRVTNRLPDRTRTFTRTSIAIRTNLQPSTFTITSTQFYDVTRTVNREVVTTRVVDIPQQIRQTVSVPVRVDVIKTEVASRRVPVPVQEFTVSQIRLPSPAQTVVVTDTRVVTQQLGRQIARETITSQIVRQIPQDIVQTSVQQIVQRVVQTRVIPCKEQRLTHLQIIRGSHIGGQSGKISVEAGGHAGVFAVAGQSGSFSGGFSTGVSGQSSRPGVQITQQETGSSQVLSGQSGAGHQGTSQFFSSGQSSSSSSSAASSSSSNSGSSQFSAGGLSTGIGESGLQLQIIQQQNEVNQDEGGSQVLSEQAVGVGAVQLSSGGQTASQGSSQLSSSSQSSSSSSSAASSSASNSGSSQFSAINSPSGVSSGSSSISGASEFSSSSSSAASSSASSSSSSQLSSSSSFSGAQSGSSQLAGVPLVRRPLVLQNLPRGVVDNQASSLRDFLASASGKSEQFVPSPELPADSS